MPRQLLAQVNRKCHSTTRLVKNGLVTSASVSEVCSSEATSLTNSLLQFQQRQRYWTSRAFTRPSHSRQVNFEQHRVHFSSCSKGIDGILASSVFECILAGYAVSPDW